MKYSLRHTFLVLLVATACGKKNDFRPRQTIESNSICLPAVASSRVEVSDYEVYLSAELIKRTLNEIAHIPNLNIQDFWSQINEATRSELNIELNVILTNQRTQDSMLILRAAAIFFLKVQGVYHEDFDYRIIDTSGFSVGFKTRNKTSKFVQPMTSNCIGDGTTELSFIKIPPVLIHVDEMKYLLKCKTDDLSFYLMTARDQVLISSGGKVYKAGLSSMTEDLSSSKLELRIKSDEINLNMTVRRQNQLDVKEWSGKKTSIDLKVAEASTIDTGACNFLNSSL